MEQRDMTRFFAVLERDLRRFLRNPIVIAMSIVMPILYLVILGNSFQGELKNLSIAVVDMDNGPYSHRVVELLHALEAGPKTMKCVTLSRKAKRAEKLKLGVEKGALF